MSSQLALRQRLGIEALEAGVADEVPVDARPNSVMPSLLRHLVAHRVTPLRETMIGTPICADFITISLVRRPVV